MVADRLSRRLWTESNNVDKQYKIDIKDFIDAKLGVLLIALVQADLGSDKREEPEGILENRYSKKLEKIMLFLTTLRKLSRMSQGEFCAFRKHVLKYAVIRKELYYQGLKNMLSRIVVDSIEKRSAILKDLYKENEHKGHKSIY